MAPGPRAVRSATGYGKDDTPRNPSRPARQRGGRRRFGSFGQAVGRAETRKQRMEPRGRAGACGCSRAPTTKPSWTVSGERGDRPRSGTRPSRRRSGWRWVVRTGIDAGIECQEPQNLPAPQLPLPDLDLIYHLGSHVVRNAGAFGLPRPTFSDKASDSLLTGTAHLEPADTADLPLGTLIRSRIA